MCVIALGYFYQLVDYMLRCWLIGVPHAKVDDVFTSMTSGHFEFANGIENVRG